MTSREVLEDLIKRNEYFKKNGVHIGTKTIDKIRELVERDTPMKPKVRYGGVYKEYNCSVCNSTLDILGVKEVNFCPKCGKRIDWSKSND